MTARRMKAIAVCQQKGGTGKTTTAGAIGAGLAKRGHSVLFVDLDPQCNLSLCLPTAAKVEAAAFEFLTDETTGAGACYDLAKGTGLYPEATIIPGSQRLAAADSIITQTGKEYRLKERFGQFAPHWDYIVVDTPPGLGILTINALAFADRVVIPCLADLFSIQATRQIGDTIEAVRRYCNPGLKIAGLLLTRYNPRQILTRDTAATLEATAAQMGTRVFNTRIRECLAIREAQAKQTNIFDYAPKGNGAKDYNALIEELTAND